jgi:hypothetical protein
MLRDAESFKAKLGKLEHGTEVGDHLAGIIKAKIVLSSTPVPQVTQDSGPKPEALFDAEEKVEEKACEGDESK